MYQNINRMNSAKKSRKREGRPEFIGNVKIQYLINLQNLLKYTVIHEHFSATGGFPKHS